MATLFVSYFENADKGVASGLLGNTTITTSTSSAVTAAAIPASAQIVEKIQRLVRNQPVTGIIERTRGY